MAWQQSLPAWYGYCTFPNRNGIFTVGATITIGLSVAGADAYTVRDWYGTILSSGAVSGTSVTPTPPAGGWKPGWYRIYFTGPNVDATNGNAYAATNFTVLRSDARFPAPPTSGGIWGGEGADPAAKAVLGLGTSRVIIANYNTPTVSPNTDTIATGLNQIAASRGYWHQLAVQHQDAARPAHELWCSTPGDICDGLNIAGSSGGDYLRAYAKDGTLNAANLYLASGPGTSSGSKIQVYYPDSSTLVETFDNLGSSTAAETAINATSAYVRAFSKGQAAAATTPATAIGRAYWDGIGQVVTAFYPEVTYYEVTNEPTLNVEFAHRVRLFQAAVRAGNAGAKVIGPCTVTIGDLAAWRTFLAAGGGNWLDGISFHDYNNCQYGALEHGRRTIEAWLALLAEFGQSGKVMWQTEAGGVPTASFGVHYPRRSRSRMLHVLLWEQYGLPRERNPFWYDKSHGFWNYPVWWQYEDNSISPDGILHRTLAEETFGMTHSARLAFGTLGDRIFLGSKYEGSAGARVVLIAASAMPGATVTLTVTGTSAPLTVVDAFGNTSTVTITGGRAVVPVQEIPTYVRLPVGADASVHSANDWPAVTQLPAWPSASPQSAAAGSGGPLRYVRDGLGMLDYAGGGLYQGGYTLPDTVTLTWPTGARVDRVIIWCGIPFNTWGPLLDFDVQTSTDGTTWTTRATVNRTAEATSFLFGTQPKGPWGTQESYWPEQWIFDVPFSSAVTVKHLRLYVRSASYGGNPDAAAEAATFFGDNPKITIQEIAALCDDNLMPHYVRQ